MHTLVRLLAGVLLLSTLTAAHAQQGLPEQPADAVDASERRGGVRYAEGPAGGADAALYGFRSVLSLNGPGIAQIDRDSLTVQGPLAIYMLGVASRRGAPPPGVSLEQLQAGMSLDKATPSGQFMYLVVDGNGTPAANVDVGFRNGRLQMTSANTMGPFADTIAPAVAEIHGIDFLQAGSYELRVLQVPPWPGSHDVLMVLWVASTTSSDDFIYVLPIPFTPGHVHTGALYRAADFFELAKPALQRTRLNPDIAPVWP